MYLPSPRPKSTEANDDRLIFEIVEYLVIGLTFFLQPLMFAIGLVLIALAAVLTGGAESAT